MKLDLVLLLFRTVDPLFEAAWRALGPRQLLRYLALPEPGQTAHAVDHLLAVLDVLDPSDGRAPAAGAYCTMPLRRSAAFNPTPRVWVGDDEAVAAAEWLHAHGLQEGRPLVALHPGSGGRWKCWPAERFAAVASALARRADAQLLLVSGPADAEIVQTFRNSVEATRVIEAASLPVCQLAAILARCSLFIGNDSGVTHLAAAVGCPTLALFGPTDDRVWGPRGTHVTILRGVNAGAAPPDPLPAAWWRGRPPEPDLSVDAVLDAAFAVAARTPRAATQLSCGTV